MELKKSPIDLVSFFVINTTFEAVPPPPNKDGKLFKFNEYPIEIDFGIQEEKGGLRALFMKVWSNIDNNKSPGYSFFIETITYFKITNEKNLDEKVISNLLTYSILALAYSNIRAVIANYSSYGPFGKFILPSIDLNDILIKKGALNKTKEDQS